MDFLRFAGEVLRWLTFGQYLDLATRLWIGYLVALGCFLLVSLFFVSKVSLTCMFCPVVVKCHDSR